MKFEHTDQEFVDWYEKVLPKESTELIDEFRMIAHAARQEALREVRDWLKENNELVGPDIYGTSWLDGLLLQFGPGGQFELREAGE